MCRISPIGTIRGSKPKTLKKKLKHNKLLIRQLRNAIKKTLK